MTRNRSASSCCRPDSRAQRLEASDRQERPTAGRPSDAGVHDSAARESGVFESVIVSTDSEDIAAIARHYGAEVPFLRPAGFSGDTSPDIEWLEYTIAELATRGRDVGLLQPAAARRARFARPRRFAVRGRCSPRRKESIP